MGKDKKADEDRYLTYYPKRQVNNRNSKYLPHVISSFVSPTMGKMIECEFQGEELLYSILEKSNSVIEYFPQPVEVTAQCHDSNEKNRRMELYYPKRRVNNRDSKHIHHVISSYISPLMNRLVECESQAEEIFFSMLEMSPNSVEEYFHQPVEVPVKVYGPNGVLVDAYNHYPDVLIFFREESDKPWLVQVKGEKTIREPSPEDVNKFRACEQYAKDEGWIFKVVYPYAMDEALQLNIKKLFPYLKSERVDEAISEMIFRTLERHQVMTLGELSRIGEPSICRKKVLPVILHELALGNLCTDFHKRIGMRSNIRIALLSDNDLYKKIL
jgi:hypothetical protein